MSYDEIRSDWPDFDRANHTLIDYGSGFIVYLDENLVIEWDTKRDHPHADGAHHNAVLNAAAALETIPNDHFEREIRKNFKRMIGEGVARSLKGDPENALDMLQRAKTYIGERNKEISRYWYLKYTGITTFIFVLLGCVCWLFRGFLIGTVGDGAFFVGIAGVSGTLGALLSVILRLGKSNLDGAAGVRLHRIEGIFRIVCGGVSAILIAIAIKAELFLPIYAHVDKVHIGMVFFGLISGASERLAPALIAKAEGGQLAIEDSRNDSSEPGNPQQRVKNESLQNENR